MGQLMKMHLERDGHVVTTMSSSMDALAALDVGTRFDMYVLDVQMPPGLRTVCRWRRWWGASTRCGVQLRHQTPTLPATMISPDALS